MGRGYKKVKGYPVLISPTFAPAPTDRSTMRANGRRAGYFDSERQPLPDPPSDPPINYAIVVGLLWFIAWL